MTNGQLDGQISRDINLHRHCVIVILKFSHAWYRYLIDVVVINRFVEH